MIGVVELQRLAARVSRTAMWAATLLLGRIDQHEITGGLHGARRPPATTRGTNLDALHIASAASLSDLKS